MEGVQGCLTALNEMDQQSIVPHEDSESLRRMALDVREEVVTQIAGFRNLWRTHYGC